MDVASRLLFGLARLAALGRTGSGQIESEAPGQLLHAGLGRLLAASEIDAAEGAFGANSASTERQPAYGALARGLERALRDPTAYQRIDSLVRIIEALLVADGAARGDALGVTRLRFGERALFSALRLLRLRSGSAPPTLLVGSLATGGTVQVPLELAAPLDRLELRYEATPAPRWSTDLWVRVPPDPNKRRLEQWPGNVLERASRIELYRQRIPGPEPVAVITSEPIAFPHELHAGQLSLQLLDQTSSLLAIRTTIRDKFQTPLAIIERVVERI